MSSRRNRQESRRNSRRNGSRNGRIGAALILILIVPRLARFAYPQLWVEDDFYLESAYLMSAGLRPYLDFVHPHMPLLELVVAQYFRLFGASHLSAEILNESAIYLTSILTFKLGERVTRSRRIGAIAALLYACSSLVFRYHVYERECFLGAAVLGAALAAMDESLGVRAQSIRQTIFFVIAASIKLTALIPLAVVIAYLAIVRRHWIDAILSGASAAAAIAVLGGLLYWRYGFEFVFQTFIFHFMKGADLTGGLAFYPARILDLMAPMFVLGCIRVVIGSQLNRGLGLVLAIIAAEYLFFGILSPTAWGHNYLDATPFIAIVAAIGLGQMVDASWAILRGRAKRAEFGWALGGWLCVAISLAAITPLVNENWLRGSVYGFGFIPRAEVSELAAALGKSTGPEESVIAPAFICFEANRRELISYPETYGVYRLAKDEFLKHGFAVARAELGRRDFFDLIGSTAHFWADQMKEAIEHGSVDAVIADSPIQLLPIVHPPLAAVDPGFLAGHDFAPLLTTEHFVLWKRQRASK